MFFSLKSYKFYSVNIFFILHTHTHTHTHTHVCL